MRVYRLTSSMQLTNVKIVKKTTTRRISYLIPAAILLSGGISSCNKSTTPTDEVAVTISNVAVKNFNLKADTKVMANLDSVFFSINLESGVIFNADSLPKGTKISRLIPVITFANGLSKAEIVMSGGSEESKTVDYLKNPNDSIDFTRDVKLNVTAADGTNTYTYTIKVNVHKENPDSLIWDKLAVTNLPSRIANPVDQKTVERGDRVYTLIEESDGTYTWSSTESISESVWDKKEVNLPFAPAIKSLAATSDSFWMLDTDGLLYESADGLAWSSTGERWVTLIGSYLESVLGVKDAGGVMMHCHYPANPIIKDTEMAPDFPIYVRSELRTIETKWTEIPTALFVGGLTSAGVRSSHTWGFDGSTWTTIDSKPTPGLEGATLFKYTVYRKTSSAFKQVAYDAWVVLGGILDNGDYNRNLYISFDNGVSWRPGSSMMSLPDVFPKISEANAVVIDSQLDADLSDAWTVTPSPDPGKMMKISYVTDGTEIMWDCPYIYILGGEMPGGTFSNAIWRGVLARLVFTPII